MKIGLRTSKPRIGDVSEALNELTGHTNFLTKLGIIIPLAVLGQLGLLALTIIVRSSQSFGNNRSENLLMLIILGFGIIILVLTFAIAFDRVRRNGEDLFSEISDEFQELPSLDVRLLMRQFNRSIQLPLLPMKGGLFIYVLISLALFFINVWFYSNLVGNLPRA